MNASAVALEKRIGETGDGEPEILAHHFAEAGQPERAASYWLDAGRREAGRSANIEAIAHLTRGIEALVPVAETRGTPAARAGAGSLPLTVPDGERGLFERARRGRLPARAGIGGAWVTIAPCSRRLGPLMTKGQGRWGTRRWPTSLKSCSAWPEQINDPGLRLQAHMPPG